MGHEIRMLTFDGNTSKKEIERLADQEHVYGCEYHSHMPPLRWLNEICEDIEKASECIDKHDDGWYDQLAVRYYEYPKTEPSKKILNLKERIAKEREKKESYAKAHGISSFKVEYVGCPHCGSKLKRTLIRGNSCPLCGTELRSKTTMDTLKRYEDNIKNLQLQIKEEERNQNQKNIKKAKIKWLVKIEYHV